MSLPIGSLATLQRMVPLDIVSAEVDADAGAITVMARPGPREFCESICETRAMRQRTHPILQAQAKRDRWPEYGRDIGLLSPAATYRIVYAYGFPHPEPTPELAAAYETVCSFVRDLVPIIEVDAWAGTLREFSTNHELLQHLATSYSWDDVDISDLVFVLRYSRYWATLYADIRTEIPVAFTVLDVEGAAFEVQYAEEFEHFGAPGDPILYNRMVESHRATQTWLRSYVANKRFSIAPALCEVFDAIARGEDEEQDNLRDAVTASNKLAALEPKARELLFEQILEQNERPTKHRQLLLKPQIDAYWHTLPQGTGYVTHWSEAGTKLDLHLPLALLPALAEISRQQASWQALVNEIKRRGTQVTAEWILMASAELLGAFEVRDPHATAWFATYLLGKADGFALRHIHYRKA